MTRVEDANLLHYYVESRFSCDAQKSCKFCAFISGKAGFLVTRQKGANLLHFKWKSRFSRDVPKRCKFVAF